ncbi:MAG: hypothetical protein JWO67_2262 [Streptosporangiaceae bacterium]|nr:hypothetical protein [Streptosporangiaceae bacterium]
MTGDDVRPRAKLPSCPLGCKERVLYARTERGANQILNPVPDDKGNVAAHKDVHGLWRARHAPADERVAAPEKRYMPHMATCRKRPEAQKPATPPPAGEGLAGVTFLNAWRAARSRQAAGQRNQRGRPRAGGRGLDVRGVVKPPPDRGGSR